MNLKDYNVPLDSNHTVTWNHAQISKAEMVSQNGNFLQFLKLSKVLKLKSSFLFNHLGEISYKENNRWTHWLSLPIVIFLRWIKDMWRYIMDETKPRYHMPKITIKMLL